VENQADARAWSLRPAGELAPDLALPWVVRLRYGLVLGEALAVLIAPRFVTLPVAAAWLGLPICAQLLTNFLLSRTLRELKANPRNLVGAVFVLDIVCLTTLLGLSGGPMNPFSVLYLVQITLSAVILQKAWTWMLGALSTLCFGLLFWASFPIPELEMHHAPGGMSVHLVGMWIAFVLGALLITFFTGKISEVLRQREQEVLTMQTQLSKQERLTSLVTLAAGAAHEMATPLATIAIAAKELENEARSRPSQDPIGEDAQLIRSEVDRCRGILERMSARGAEPRGEAPTPIDAEELLEKVRGEFPASRRPRILVDGGAPAQAIVVPVTPTIQALAALVNNGLEASSAEQPVLLGVESGTFGLRFSVKDDGHGMSAEVLSRVAEPFFTTKPPGKGMGLGTFLVHLFAERLGGKLRFDTEPGQGCRVTLELPLLDKADRSHGNG
jgi:two-component system sensor histidine kinase RegB